MGCEIAYRAKYFAEDDAKMYTANFNFCMGVGRNFLGAPPPGPLGYGPGVK